MESCIQKATRHSECGFVFRGGSSRWPPACGGARRPIVHLRRGLYSTSPATADQHARLDRNATVRIDRPNGLCAPRGGHSLSGGQVHDLVANPPSTTLRYGVSDEPERVTCRRTPTAEPIGPMFGPLRVSSQASGRGAAGASRTSSRHAHVSRPPELAPTVGACAGPTRQRVVLVMLGQLAGAEELSDRGDPPAGC